MARLFLEQAKGNYAARWKKPDQQKERKRRVLQKRQVFRKRLSALIITGWLGRLLKIEEI